MNPVLLWMILILSIGCLVSLIALLRRTSGNDESRKGIQEELRAGREESRNAARDLREEVAQGIKCSGETLSAHQVSAAQTQQNQLNEMTEQLSKLKEGNQTDLGKIRDTFDKRVKELQDGNERKLDQVRRELADGMKASGDSTKQVLEGMRKDQNELLGNMTKQLKDTVDENRKELDTIRQTVDKSVKDLQESNEKKLEEMRKTVDEKLHDTLEKRLGESFKLVSDRLEAVHKGLGEMQNLAVGVGDLQRVLTNVKARGTWAEYQLGALLEQVLTPDQYSTNVKVNPESSESVEFAIKLPGPKDDPGTHVWLPIDSKFPQEDYIRLQEVSDQCDSAKMDVAVKAFNKAIKKAADDVSKKYILPPHTTDFAIMFLATEGLYAEVIRQPALIEELQQCYRIVIAGPTTLVALLSSLRMGFRTLAIEKRASEVWQVLGAVKTEFGKFGEAIGKVKTHLGRASNAIDATGVRTRVLEKKLKGVESLSEEDALKLLSLSSILDETDDVSEDKEEFAGTP